MENEGQQDMDASSPRSIEDGLPVSHERVLKFEVQLYKATLPGVREGEYMLDIQVGGRGNSGWLPLAWLAARAQPAVVFLHHAAGRLSKQVCGHSTCAFLGTVCHLRWSVKQ